MTALPARSNSTSPARAQFPAGTVLGYPRIGPRRELKKAIESFWAGRTSARDLEQAAAALRTRTRTRLVELGLDPSDASIPSDFSFYDQVLDAAVVVGAVPDRFAHLLDAGTGRLNLAGYSTVARGAGEDAPLEMTKWFDTNYHYLVPEIGPDTTFRFADDRPVREFTEGLAQGVLTRPVIVGPVTFLLLAKAADGAPAGFAPIDRLADLLPVYVELLSAFAAAGATWVQLDEPALVSDSIEVAPQRAIDALVEAYTRLATDLARPDRPAILVAAPYGSLGAGLPALASTGVDAIGVDLVRGDVPGAPVPGLETKTLVAGVIDGHNIWRADLGAALDRLESLGGLGAAAVTVATSTSLLHLPHDIDDEPALDPTLRGWLAFADQKVGEVVTLSLGLTKGRDAVTDLLEAARAAAATRPAAPGVVRPRVRDRLAGLTDADFRRGDYAARKAAQAARLQLPPLPTTTIGSFPQTPEIRKARAAHAQGALSTEGYETEMRAEIRRVVDLQERIGLDVLVHGEPERNDMVQYFAENLDGFAATQNGWVQSYGSRCVRPPILWGDVSRPAPITVRWSAYTASLTAKPVKGMLTGPVTILAWSFVRNDQPLADTANQVALALRDEIADLEAAGIGVVQVDEPALRELLPLRAVDHAAYLDWSVASFRLATSGVRTETQVHTHLCYSEFGEVIGAIDRLDADVTSIEAARSKMEVLADISAQGYPRGIGPGVYDIHSPRVPSEAEVAALLGKAVGSVPADQLWINPDCGLKTRRYEEVTPALEHIVAAARTVRASLPA
jgi:5-methyltetrahydropteroyltriglutamate--homocysteine methyltransferase